jgi:hypothetical protein
MANNLRWDDRHHQVNMVRESISQRFKLQVMDWAEAFNLNITTKTALEGSLGTIGYMLRLMVDLTEYAGHKDGIQLFPITTRILNFTVPLGEYAEIMLPQRQALAMQDVQVRTANLLDQYARTKQLTKKGPPKQDSPPPTIDAPAFTIAGFRFENSGKPNHVWMHRADGPHAGEGAEVHTDMLRKALADFFTKEF